MRNKFDSELLKLDKQLIEMGALIEEAIKLATDSIIKKDISMVKEVSEYERKIDAKERDIEALCLKIFVEQQPVATDFRVVSAILKMITDMERIGDHAEDISEITMHLSEQNFKGLEDTILIDLKTMANTTIKMVKDSIDAFVDKNLELAYSVAKQDDIVDNLFLSIKSHIVDLISDNKTNASSALDLLMITKYLERIGDHAENIAEWVVYTIIGEHKLKD